MILESYNYLSSDVTDGVDRYIVLRNQSRTATITIGLVSNVLWYKNTEHHGHSNILMNRKFGGLLALMIMVFVVDVLSC
jgi:uncharacterized protein YwbE